MLVETPQPKSMPAPKPKHPVNMQAASQTLKVYPNPSQGQTIFEYRYPAQAETLYLSIYSSQGGLLQTIKLDGQSGVYIWNAENYVQGSYLYKISSGNRILDSGIIQLNK